MVAEFLNRQGRYAGGTPLDDPVDDIGGDVGLAFA
jgi:hypothetical protein